MEINLEKIDIIRERTGVSYREAKEVLEKYDGNVVEALIELEDKTGRNWTETMGIAGNEVIEKLKAIIKKGNVTKIILKKDGEVLLNIPVTAGAVGVVLAPLVSILGVSTALASRATIEIVKSNGEVVDLNDMAEDKVNELRNMMRSDKSKKKEEIDNILGDDKDDEEE
ncbi:DUF4342 domain-containing protein [Alkaliphilus crotonatoxidans]